MWPFIPGERFPYVNFHAMNQDWILSVVIDFQQKYNTIQQQIDSGVLQINNTTAQKLSELNSKAAQIETLLNSWYNTHSANIQNTLAAAIRDFDIHIAQITAETIQSIPQDYSSMADLVNNIKKYNAVDVIPHTSGSHTVNGITYSWNTDGSCAISGTATADARETIYDNISALPAGIIAGQTYYIDYSASVTRLQILSYAIGGEGSVVYTGRGEDGTITIPNNAIGLWIRLLVPNGASNLNETVHPIILNGLSNKQLTGNAVDLAPDVAQLKTDVKDLKTNELSMNFSAASNLNSPALWEQGSINPETGENVISSTRMRSKGYLPSNISEIQLPDSTKGFFILAYDYSDNYIGVYNSDGTFNTTGNGYDFFNLSTIYQNHAYKIRIYLYTRDSNPVTTEYANQIILKSIYNQLINPVNIRIMQNNIGQFNFGYDGGYAGADIGLKLSNYRQMLMKYKPDIIGLQEYRTFVDALNTRNADYILFNDIIPYKSYEEYGYVILSKYKPYNTRHVYLHSEGDYPVHMVYGNIIVDNMEVIIGTTALNTLGGSADASMKIRALNRMVSLLSGTKTAIICADANPQSQEEADAIKAFMKAAGYRTANWDYAGYLESYNPYSNIYKCIDTIFIKGNARFAQIDMVPKNEYSNLLSDHLPIIADITIYKD